MRLFSSNKKAKSSPSKPMAPILTASSSSSCSSGGGGGVEKETRAVARGSSGEGATANNYRKKLQEVPEMHQLANQPQQHNQQSSLLPHQHYHQQQQMEQQMEQEQEQVQQLEQEQQDETKQHDGEGVYDPATEFVVVRQQQSSPPRRPVLLRSYSHDSFSTFTTAAETPENISLEFAGFRLDEFPAEICVPCQVPTRPLSLLYNRRKTSDGGERPAMNITTNVQNNKKNILPKSSAAAPSWRDNLKTIELPWTTTTTATTSTTNSVSKEPRRPVQRRPSGGMDPMDAMPHRVTAKEYRLRRFEI